MCELLLLLCYDFFFFKHKTAYEMRISDWSSDVCSADLHCCPHKLRCSRSARAGTYDNAAPAPSDRKCRRPDSELGSQTRPSDHEDRSPASGQLHRSRWTR